MHAYGLDLLTDDVNVLLPEHAYVGWDYTDGNFSLDSYSWDKPTNSLIYPSIEELYAALQGMLAGLELNETGCTP